MRHHARRARHRASTATPGTSILLWDNYPVNDLDPTTLYLGPLRGRDPRHRRREAARASSRTRWCRRPVEARARDGRRLGARPARLRPARVVRARARGPRRRGAATRARRARARRRRRRPTTSTALVRGARARRRRARPALRCWSRSCDRRRRLRRDRGRRRRRGRGARGRRAASCSSSRGAHIGGMVSGGLSWTDVGDTRVLGGFARRFYGAVAEHYGAPLWEVKGPEPHVAEEILGSFLDGVDVRLGETELPEAAVYVDASYEGDVLARARRPVRGRPRVARALRRALGRTAARVPAVEAQLRRACSRRSPTTARCCRTSASRSSTTRGWPVERLGEGDGGAAGVPVSASASRRARTASRSSSRTATTRASSSSSTATSQRAAGCAGCWASSPTCSRTGSATSTRSGRSRSTCSTAATASTSTATARPCARTTSRTRSVSLLPATSAGPRESRRGGSAPTSSATRGGWPHQLYVRDGAPHAGRARADASTICSSRARTTTSSRSARTTSTSARSSGRGGCCRSTRATPAVFNEGYLSVRGAAVSDPVPLASTPRRERRARPARAGVPVGVPRRVRVGADGADADAARPRGRRGRRAGGAPGRRGAGRRRRRAPAVPSATKDRCSLFDQRSRS